MPSSSFSGERVFAPTLANLSPWPRAGCDGAVAMTTHPSTWNPAFRGAHLRAAQMVRIVEPKSPRDLAEGKGTLTLVPSFGRSVPLLGWSSCDGRDGESPVSRCSLCFYFYHIRFPERPANWPRVSRLMVAEPEFEPQ